MMEQQQLVEKITHLESQLKRLEQFEFSIRSTFAIASFLTRRINRYKVMMNQEQSVFEKPISA